MLLSAGSPLTSCLKNALNECRLEARARMVRRRNAVKQTRSWEIKQLWLFAGSSYDSESLDPILLCYRMFIQTDLNLQPLYIQQTSQAPPAFDHF